MDFVADNEALTNGRTWGLGWARNFFEVEGDVVGFFPALSAPNKTGTQRKGTVIKVYIKSNQTGLYYTGEHQWSESPLGALHFRWSSHAIRFAHENAMSDVDLVYEFANDLKVVPMPVLKEGASESLISAS